MQEQQYPPADFPIVFTARLHEHAMVEVATYVHEVAETLGQKGYEVEAHVPDRAWRDLLLPEDSERLLSIASVVEELGHPNHHVDAEALRELAGRLEVLKERTGVGG